MAEITVDLPAVDADKLALIHLAKDFLERLAARDSAWVADHLAPGFVFVRNDMLMERDAFLQALASPKMQLTKAHMYNVHVIYQTGDRLAVIRLESTVTWQTEEIESWVEPHNWQTLVYRLDADGVWRMIHSQAYVADMAE